MLIITNYKFFFHPKKTLTGADLSRIQRSQVAGFSPEILTPGQASSYRRSGFTHHQFNNQSGSSEHQSAPSNNGEILMLCYFDPFKLFSTQFRLAFGQPFVALFSVAVLPRSQNQRQNLSLIFKSVLGSLKVTLTRQISQVHQNDIRPKNHGAFLMNCYIGQKFCQNPSRRPAWGQPVFASIVSATQRIMASAFKQLTFSAFTELTGSTHLESNSGGGSVTLEWRNWKCRLNQLYQLEVMLM